ncbi:hypothetical protein AN1V17_32230 [Vallitalea sediminicola]
MLTERFLEFTHHILINACEMSYVEEAPGTLELLQRLDRILKYYGNDKEYVSLNQEINILQDYFFIMKMKHGNICDLRFLGTNERKDIQIHKFSIISYVDKIIQEHKNDRDKYTTYNISVEIDEPITLLVESQSNEEIKSYECKLNEEV